MHYAARGGHVEICRLLHKAGADPHVCTVRALQRWASGALHPSKWPQAVVLMDALPLRGA